MKTVPRHLLVGTASLSLATVALYGCKNFLTDAAKPDGTLNSQSLATKAGVEGTLIAAYRPLDCTGNTNGNWGCAASNWVWASVAGDDDLHGQRQHVRRQARGDQYIGIEFLGGGVHNAFLEDGGQISERVREYVY